MVLKQMNEANFNQESASDPYPNNYSNVSIINKGFSQKNQDIANQQRYRDQSIVDRKCRLEFVSSNQQCSLIKYGDTVNFNHKERIVTDHSDAILCIFFVSQKYVATGSKDKTINIYSFDGSKVATLKGHNASICCLSMIRNLNGDKYLASGSDHGCSSLILWDTRTWNIQSKIACHTAAVTAIVDLQDGRHLVTGSYDKKINLFSHAKGKLINSLSNNKTSVTSMVMTSDKSRLISAGLDNSLSIWTIQRKNDVISNLFYRLLTLLFHR